jgi:hypothetical protein
MFHNDVALLRLAQSGFQAVNSLLCVTERDMAKAGAFEELALLRYPAFLTTIADGTELCTFFPGHMQITKCVFWCSNIEAHAMMRQTADPGVLAVRTVELSLLTTAGELSPIIAHLNAMYSMPPVPTFLPLLLHLTSVYPS